MHTVAQAAFAFANGFTLGFCAIFTTAILFAAFGWASLFFTVPTVLIVGANLGNSVINPII